MNQFTQEQLRELENWCQQLEQQTRNYHLNLGRMSKYQDLLVYIKDRVMSDTEKRDLRDKVRYCIANDVRVQNRCIDRQKELHESKKCRYTILKLTSNIRDFNNVCLIGSINKRTNESFVSARSLSTQIDTNCEYWIKKSFKKHKDQSPGISHLVSNYTSQTKNENYIKLIKNPKTENSYITGFHLCIEQAIGMFVSVVYCKNRGINDISGQLENIKNRIEECKLWIKVEYLGSDDEDIFKKDNLIECVKSSYENYGGAIYKNSSKTTE